MSEKTTKVLGVKVPRGEKMTRGTGWKLVPPGRKRAFKATLLKVIYRDGDRLATFRVF